MASKKILIFSHNFIPAIDGGSQLLLRIAQSLKSQNREIRILTSDAFSTDDYIQPWSLRIKPGWQTRGNLKIFRLKTWRWGYKFLKLLNLKLFAKGPIFFKLPILWLKLWHPDIIIAGVFPTTIPIYARLLQKITKAKLILVPCFHKQDDFYLNSLLKNSLKQADKIYVLTKKEKDTYVKNFKVKSDKIKIIKPSINKALILNKKKKIKLNKIPTLLYFGSQSAHKKIDLLISAFEKLTKEIPDLKLIIAGQKTLFSPKLEKQISSLPTKIRAKIRLLGKCSEKKKQKLLDQCWLLINPSEHESFGLIFLEAWARKKTILAANLAVLKELIDINKNGILFEKNDLKDLIKKIKKAINSPKKLKKMGESGYQKLITNYTFDKLSNSLEL